MSNYTIVNLMIHQILPGGSVDVAMAAEGNLEIVLKEGLKCG